MKRLGRRVFLSAAGAVLALPATATLTATPRQTPGPFYPRPLPLEIDADLVRVQGAKSRAMGTVTHVSGRILDQNGNVIPNALVEIWQCDARGRYRHPRDPGPRDTGFQGYGRTETKSDGAYAFRTIRPVPYPGRAPHIHFAVTVPGAPPWTTQMYVNGDAANDRDFLLSRVTDADARALLLVDLVEADTIEPGALAGTFDIVLPKS